MIRDMTLADALIVCAGMRQEDAACMRAVRNEEPGDWCAVDRWQSHGPAWALYQDGEPWAIGGLTLLTGWSAVMWFIAREGMREQSWRHVLRQTRTVIERASAHDNPERRHRIEAHVLHGWAGATKLVRHLGFRFEGIRHQAGANGESFEVWAHLSPIGAKTHARKAETPAEVENCA